MKINHKMERRTVIAERGEHDTGKMPQLVKRFSGSGATGGFAEGRASHPRKINRNGEKNPTWTEVQTWS